MTQHDTPTAAQPAGTDHIAEGGYLLLILEPPGQREARSPAEGEALYAAMLDYAATLKARGQLRLTQALSREQHRVQRRAGTTQVLDGPFTEAKELIGGFFLLDCDTLDEALAIAAACPAAGWATVEVRALGPCYT